MRLIMLMIMFAVMVVAMFTQRKQTVNLLLAFVVQTFMLANVSAVDHTIWPLPIWVCLKIGPNGTPKFHGFSSCFNKNDRYYGYKLDSLSYKHVLF